MRVIKFAVWTCLLVVALVCALWAFGAVYFDFPIVTLRNGAASLFGLLLLGMLIFVPGKVWKLTICLGGFFLVLCWWLTLKPTNDRAWQPDVAQTAWAQINGDEVTFHNVRNCDYRTDTDFTTHWETRTVRLSQITGMDVFIMYWGSPWMAH